MVTDEAGTVEFFCQEKEICQTRNWGEDNNSLKQRGSLTIWFSQEALNHRLNPEPSGERRAFDTHTDLATETKATVQAIYALPGRQRQGSEAELGSATCQSLSSFLS